MYKSISEYCFLWVALMLKTRKYITTLSFNKAYHSWNNLEPVNDMLYSSLDKSFDNFLQVLHGVLGFNVLTLSVNLKINC